LDKNVLVDNKPLKGSIKTKVNLEPVSVEFKENNLLLANLPLNILGKVAVLDQGIDFDLEVKSKNASLENLFSLVPESYQQWYEGMSFKGNSDIDLKLTGMMQDSISNPDLNIKLKITNGTIAAKQFQNIPVDNLQTKAELNLPQLNPDSLSIDVSEFVFNLDKGFAKGKVLYRAPLFVDATLNTQLNVSQLWQTLNLSGTELKGAISLNGSVKGNYITKSIKNKQNIEITKIVKIPTFNIKANWQTGYFKWNKMPLAITDLNFDLDAVNTDGTYENTSITIENLNAKAEENYVKRRLKVNNLTNFDTDTDFKAFVELADIHKIFLIKEIDFGVQLSVDTIAKGSFNLNRNKLTLIKSILNIINRFLLYHILFYLPYHNLADFPLEKINSETHITSHNGSLNDLRVHVLPISFILANEPFHIDANLFNFNNLTFDIGTKGKLNLGNLYELFKIDGLSVSGQIETNVKLKGKGNANDASSINNRGFVLLRNIHIKSEFFPHDFVFTEGKFKFYKKKMVLENIKMNYAKQQFILNGGLENYINYFLTPNATLKGNLNVTSKFIDVNSFMFGSSSSEN